MSTATSIQVSSRDRAVLRAIAEGRCVMSGTCGIALTIDGFCCADQFAGVRLTGLGLIATTSAAATPPQLTPTGRALLAA